jgi:hypothetical protein
MVAKRNVWLISFMAGPVECFEVIVPNFGSSIEECMNTSINFVKKNVYNFFLTVTSMAIVRSVCVCYVAPIQCELNSYRRKMYKEMCRYIIHNGHLLAFSYILVHSKLQVS